MKKSPVHGSSRTGAVAPFVALIIFPVFLLMLAFAVDMGNICFTQAQLQNAADAAALAGAAELVKHPPSPTSPTDYSSAVTDATAEAERVAKQMAAGNVSSLALASSDVQVGFTVQNTNKSPGAFTAYPGVVSGVNNNRTPFPNTVKVTVRRDSTSNKPQPTFFASFFGQSSWSLTATATANTIMASVVFNPAAQGSLLLPLAMPQYSSTDPSGNLHLGWTDLMAMWQTGASLNNITTGPGAIQPKTVTPTDNYNVGSTLNAPNSGTPFGNYPVSNGTDGVPEATLYGAGSSPSPGNFGLTLLNPSASPSTPNIENWISNGPSATDLASLPSIPGSWNAGPGFKDAINSSVTNIVGEARLIPIYDNVGSGGGANGTYNIVGFGAVIVLNWSGNGSKNTTMVIQPTTLIDPSLSGSNYGSGSAPNTPGNNVYAAPKLTQ